jgi:membrane-anchored glycerophosphoryl diester phosphodiesterase (GDPDase)
VFWGVIGSVAIVVAVLVVLIRLVLSLPVLVLEQVTAIGSLRRSWNLVKGATLRTLGIFLVAGVAIGVVSSVTGLFYSADMFEGLLTGDMGGYLVLVLISGAVNTLVSPILPTLLTLLYYDYAGLSPGVAMPE